MIQKFREADFLTNIFFGVENENAPPLPFRFFFAFLLGWLGLIPGLLIGGVIFDAVVPGIIMLTVSILATIPFWGYLSVRRGYPKTTSYGRGRHYHDIKGAMDDYFSLTREERNAYPDNINTIVKNRFLTDKQLSKINDSMHETYRSVLEARQATAALEAKNIDISDILSDFDHRRESVEIKTKTYRQFTKELS